MMDFLRIFLPVYFTVYFGIAFVVKSIVVSRRIGKNALVLTNEDNAYGLIGYYFKLTLVGLFLYVVVYGLFPDWYGSFLPIALLDHPIVLYVGLCFMLSALVWTIIAQGQMKDSWRIGIDMETNTPLVVKGLFATSRNPIFFGMVVSLIGLFLVTPNGLTALFLILGYVLIQIQIRLEEEFLAQQHGQIYLDYKHRVRRWI